MRPQPSADRARRGSVSVRTHVPCLRRPRVSVQSHVAPLRPSHPPPVPLHLHPHSSSSGVLLAAPDGCEVVLVAVGLAFSVITTLKAFPRAAGHLRVFLGEM